MKVEVSNWLRQAEADLESAKATYDIKKYYVCVFLSEQAVEKALKALFIHEKNELIKTHSVSRLAKLVDVPELLFKKILFLEPVYQACRYPDVSSKIPAEEFDEFDAKKFLNIAEEVFIWIEKRMK